MQQYIGESRRGETKGICLYKDDLSPPGAHVQLFFICAFGNEKRKSKSQTHSPRAGRRGPPIMVGLNAIDLVAGLKEGPPRGHARG